MMAIFRGPGPDAFLKLDSDLLVAVSVSESSFGFLGEPADSSSSVVVAAWESVVVV